MVESLKAGAPEIYESIIIIFLIIRYLTAMGPILGLKTREEMMDFMLKKTGQKRVLEPYEIGKVATFLCRGGKCITGMSINADGGIHLG